MESLTKAVISEAEIRSIAENQFGCGMKSCKELNDGFYNISFLVTMEDGRESVLKIAPPSDVPILTYEKDIMATEVMFYRMVHDETDLPVPDVFGYDKSGSIIPNDYYFMSKLEGQPLTHIGDISNEMRREVYEQLAGAMAKIHGIKGEGFGYRTMPVHGNGDALSGLIQAVEVLFEDAQIKGETIPLEASYIRKVFERTRPAFSMIEQPCMVHFDLWDGNIFVEEGRPLKVDGYIDFERGFWADPSADFAQIVGYMDLQDNQWFIEAYNDHAVEKISYDSSFIVRTYAYRCYLMLIMHVECAYRDINGSFDNQKQWVAEELPKWFRKLEEALEAF